MVQQWYEENGSALNEEIFKWIAKINELRHRYSTDDIIQNFHEVTSNVMDSAKGTSCSKGCSFCCHDKIILSKMEASYLRPILEKTKPNMDRLRKQNQTDDVFKLKWADRACALLVNGECSIYDNRPLICRTHNSTESPDLCKVGDSGKGPSHGQLFSIDMEAVQMALLMIDNLATLPVLSESPTLHETLYNIKR